LNLGNLLDDQQDWPKPNEVAFDGILNSLKNLGETFSMAFSGDNISSNLKLPINASEDVLKAASSFASWMFLGIIASREIRLIIALWPMAREVLMFQKP